MSKVPATHKFIFQCKGAFWLVPGELFYFMHKGKKYWETVHSRMKREEDNDYCYKMWFNQGALNIFKKDIGELKLNHVLSKIDKTKPYSPSNWQWIVRPNRILTKPKRYKPKYIRACYTLIFEVEIGTDFNKAAIYKLTFSNGEIYIGSTSMVKKRVSCFTATFNGTSAFHNKRMATAIAECDYVKFSVVQYVDDLITLKDLETKEIAKYANNPLLINRSMDANSNKGIVWTAEESLKKKETLIAKYKSGELKMTPYKDRKPRKDRRNLFDSKIFGDKKW